MYMCSSYGSNLAYINNYKCSLIEYNVETQN